MSAATSTAPSPLPRTSPMISRIPYGDLATSYRSPPTRASAAAARYTTPSSSGPTCLGSGLSSARWAASATEVTAASFWLPRALRTAPSALIKVTMATVMMVAKGSHCVAAGETTAPAIAVRMLIPPQMSGVRALRAPIPASAGGTASSGSSSSGPGHTWPRHTMTTTASAGTPHSTAHHRDHGSRWPAAGWSRHGADITPPDCGLSRCLAHYPPGTAAHPTDSRAPPGWAAMPPAVTRGNTQLAIRPRPASPVAAAACCGGRCQLPFVGLLGSAAIAHRPGQPIGTALPMAGSRVRCLPRVVPGLGVLRYHRAGHQPRAGMIGYSASSLSAPGGPVPAPGRAEGNRGMNNQQQVSDLLHEAGETHHRVYRIVDGADDDWASWYADWLINLSELPALLGTRPVR